MTSFYTFDLRYSSTKEVLEAAARALKYLPEGKPEWFDGLFVLEHAEELVGVAFATAQVYLGGALSVLKKVKGIKRGKEFREFRANLLQQGQTLDLFPSVSKVEVIYAAANYWKHHGEWENWEPNDLNRDTIETLAKIEVDGKTEFPCHTIATLLGGDDYTELDWLLKVISEWRHDAMVRSNICLEAKPPNQADAPDQRASASPSLSGPVIGNRRPAAREASVISQSRRGGHK